MKQVSNLSCFFLELFTGCHGPPVTSDCPISQKQDEPPEPVNLLCSSSHAGFQPGTACGQQYLRTHPDTQIPNRNLAKESGWFVNSENLTFNINGTFDSKDMNK